MTDKERGDLVHKILRALKVAHAFKKERAAAHEEVAPFDEVDTFFSSCFHE